MYFSANTQMCGGGENWAGCLETARARVAFLE